MENGEVLRVANCAKQSTLLCIGVCQQAQCLVCMCRDHDVIEPAAAPTIAFDEYSAVTAMHRLCR